MNGGLRKFVIEEQPGQAVEQAVPTAQVTEGDDHACTQALLRVFQRSLDELDTSAGAPGSPLQNAFMELLTVEDLLRTICATTGAVLNVKTRAVFFAFHNDTLATIRKYK